MWPDRRQWVGTVGLPAAHSLRPGRPVYVVILPSLPRSSEQVRAQPPAVRQAEQARLQAGGGPACVSCAAVQAGHVLATALPRGAPAVAGMLGRRPKSECMPLRMSVNCLRRSPGCSRRCGCRPQPAPRRARPAARGSPPPRRPPAQTCPPQSGLARCQTCKGTRSWVLRGEIGPSAKQGSRRGGTSASKCGTPWAGQQPGAAQMGTAAARSPLACPQTVSAAGSGGSSQQRAARPRQLPRGLPAAAAACLCRTRSAGMSAGLVNTLQSLNTSLGPARKAGRRRRAARPQS